MAAAMSSGTNQELTLDRSSFEKLLAAAWVLQCLHDQLHSPVDGGNAIARPATVQEKIKLETASSGPTVLTKPEITETTLQPLPMVIDTPSKPVVRITGSADDETLSALVKTQEVIETGSLELDATVKRLVSLSPKLSHAPTTHELAPVNLTPAGGKADIPARSKAEAEFIKPSSVLEKLPDHNNPAQQPSAFNVGAGLVRLRDALARHASSFRAGSALRALRAGTIAAQVNLRASFVRLRDALVRYQAAFRRRTDKEPTSLGSWFNLQPMLRRLRDAWVKHTSTVRINFTLRSLRAVAIATPVWLLVMVASLLLLETWLHQAFQGARAMSAPSPAAAQAAMTVNTTAPAHSARSLKQPAKKVEGAEHQLAQIPRFASSHEQIPDAATASVVAQLSRFEIRGLRRQAKFGDDSAAFTLGMVYEIGRYVRPNCTEAARWVTMAAEAGNPAAQYDLGLRYRDGDGVSVNLHESEKWLRKAAAHKYRNAKLALQLLASR